MSKPNKVEEILKTFKERGRFKSPEEVDEYFEKALTDLVSDTQKKERQAWLYGKRCSSCGDTITPNPLTDTCGKCWEE